MVHPTNKVGHRTTGTMGIPHVSDCTGTISREEWDTMVIQEAAAAKAAALEKAEEKRRQQQEHATILLQQMSAKKQRDEEQKKRVHAEDTKRLQADASLAQTQDLSERRLRDLYRDYLHHCHEFSMASQGLLHAGTVNSAGCTLTSQGPLGASDTTYHTPQRKLVLQQQGGNMMPFIGPSASARERIDNLSKLELKSALQDYNARSPSPRDMVSDKWKTQKDAYDHELQALTSQEQRRQMDKQKLQDKIDRRAQRALRVAPQPPSLPLTPKGADAPNVSPRQPTAPAFISRRQVQDAIRTSIETQIAERQRAADDVAAQRRDEEAKRVKRIEDMILSQKSQEQQRRDATQRSYRAALENQFRDHTQPKAAGFLPDVAVNPFRGQKSRV